MKKLFLIAVLVLSLLLSGCQADRHRSGKDETDEKKITVQDHRISGCYADEYSMDITLDTHNNAVYGTSVVKITNTTDTALEAICFRLYSANISRGIIESASDEDTGREYTVNTQKDPSVIYLSLDADPIPSGASRFVKLNFRSDIPESDDRLGCIVDKNGKLYNMTFCFPQLADFRDGKWSETEYADNGESYCYEMTNYHVTLTAPADYVVLSSGKSETVNGTTVIEAPNVREMAISACNFAQVKSMESNGITFNVLTPEYAGFVTRYLEDLYDLILTVAVESAQMYTEKVGAYIYDELDIIPMAHGGMEMPGLIQVALPLTEYEDFSCAYPAATTAHEVGHQWFYCAVSNDAGREPWLDEGFTSYLENLYWDEFLEDGEVWKAFNDRYTPNYSIMEYVSGFAYVEEPDLDGYINLPIYEYPEDEYSAVVYGKGSWFLRKLELTMGTDRFFEMLGAWYEENLNQVVTGRAFITHVLTYDSSQSVQDVIDEYISEEAL